MNSILFLVVLAWWKTACVSPSSWGELGASGRYTNADTNDGVSMIPTEVVHEALIPIGRYSSTNSRADLPQTASESAFTRTLAECDDGEVEDACGVCDGTDSLGLGCDATGTIFTANLPVGSPWPMLGRNVFRASYTPIRTNTSTRGDLKWSYTTSDAVIGSPSISSDGTIYAGDTGGGLYGIDTQTGRTRYQTTLASGTSATPVIDESGNVYIGTNDGSFYSLTANLTVRWQFPTSDAISSNALVYNNAVFFGSQNRLMYAVEKDTGELIWSVRVVAQILTNPVLSTDGQVIILLVSNDDVYTISVADGSRNRRRIRGISSAADSFASPGLFLDGDVLIPTVEGSLYKVDVESLSVVEEVGAPISAIYTTPITGPDGTIYIGLENGRMVALNGYTGGFIWLSAAGTSIYGQPTLTSEGILYHTNFGGELIALNSSTGSVIFKVQADASGSSSSPAIGADGSVYIGGFSGALYSYGGHYPTCNTSAGLSTDPVSGFNANDFIETPCALCEAGYFSSASACALCFPGTVSSVRGTSECDVCDAGTFSDAYGSTQCADCGAGSYSNMSGSAACTVCEAGEYQPNPGAVQCLPCDMGSVSTTTASTSCSNCTAGSYAASEGLSACTLCDAGSFSSTGGAIGCVLCDQGTYSLAGASTCTPCAPGSISTGAGASSCDDFCPPGFYSEDAVNCLACDAGTFSETQRDGSVDCITCPQDTISSTGSNNCTACPQGQYSFDNRACMQCEWPSYYVTSDYQGSNPCTAFKLFHSSPIIAYIATAVLAFVIFSVLWVSVVRAIEIRGHPMLRVTRLGLFIYLLPAAVETFLHCAYFVNDNFDKEYVLFLQGAFLGVHPFIGMCIVLRKLRAWPKGIFRTDNMPKIFANLKQPLCGWLGVGDDYCPVYKSYRRGAEGSVEVQERPMFSQSVRESYACTRIICYMSVYVALGIIQGISILAWYTLSLPWVILNLFSFILYVFEGLSIYQTKAICLQDTWNTWVPKFTGVTEFNSTQAMSLLQYNECFFLGVATQSIPQILLQATNNFSKGEWNYLEYASVGLSVFMVVHAFVKLISRGCVRVSKYFHLKDYPVLVDVCCLKFPLLNVNDEWYDAPEATISGYSTSDPDRPLVALVPTEGEGSREPGIGTGAASNGFAYTEVFYETEDGTRGYLRAALGTADSVVSQGQGGSDIVEGGYKLALPQDDPEHLEGGGTGVSEEGKAAEEDVNNDMRDSGASSGFLTELANMITNPHNLGALRGMIGMGGGAAPGAHDVVAEQLDDDVNRAVVARPLSPQRDPDFEDPADFDNLHNGLDGLDGLGGGFNQEEGRDTSVHMHEASAPPMPQDEPSAPSMQEHMDTGRYIP